MFGSERRETFHNRRARKATKELTDISHPRRLRVKGADTESPNGAVALIPAKREFKSQTVFRRMGKSLQQTVKARLHDSSGL